MGKIYVDISDNENHTEITEKLKVCFDIDVEVSNIWKILSKLTIVGLSPDMKEENLVKTMCIKDSNIKTFIQNKTVYEILKCWDMK